MLPLFAAGFDFEITLPDGAAPGQTAFAVPDASLYLAPGDPIFISEAGGADPECLGPAASMNAGGIVTTYPLLHGKTAGARLWTPEHALLFPVAPSPPIRQTVATGVETLVTADGQVVQTRVAAPLASEELTLRGLTRSEREAVLAWLEEATEWGLLPFLYVDARREARSARLGKPPVQLAESKPNIFAITLTLLLVE